jgi:hypothetical protein
MFCCLAEAPAATFYHFQIAILTILHKAWPRPNASSVQTRRCHSPEKQKVFNRLGHLA